MADATERLLEPIPIAVASKIVKGFLPEERDKKGKSIFDFK